LFCNVNIENEAEIASGGLYACTVDVGIVSNEDYSSHSLSVCLPFVAAF